MSRYGLVAALFALAAGARGDVRPGRLASCRGAAARELRGFSPASSPARTFGVSYEQPEGVTAAISRRYFRGSIELRYHVLLFSSVSALEGWDRRGRRSSPAWHGIPEAGCTRARIIGTYVTKADLAAARRSAPPTRSDPLAPYRRARQRALGYYAVGRAGHAVVVVYGFQHREMARRDPASAPCAISDEALRALVERVSASLLASVAAIHANRASRPAPVERTRTRAVAPRP